MSRNDDRERRGRHVVTHPRAPHRLLNAERAAQDKRIEEQKKRDKERERQALKKKKMAKAKGGGGAVADEPSSGVKAMTKAIGAIKMGAQRRDHQDWKTQKVQFDALTGMRLAPEEGDAEAEEEGDDDDGDYQPTPKRETSAPREAAAEAVEIA